MANPYPSVFNTAENNSTRLEGDITFTDPANQPGGGGGGTVDSVTAGDSSITIGGTAADPTVAVAALGVTTAKLAANAVTTAKLANGAVGVTQMTSGAATANQVATADGAGNVSYATPTGVASVSAGDTSIVIGGTGANPTVETASLDVIAADHATGGNVSMNSHKITNLTNGASAQDAAAFGQIPTALPPNGSAGGDLSGSYPNPTVAAIEGVAVSGTAPTANQVLTASDATHAAWATPSSGFANPMTTKGDIIIEDASPAPARLAIGSTGQVLTVASGLPSWATPSGGGYVQLFSSVLGASAANFDITSISGSYFSLRLLLYLRSDASGTNLDNALCRFNNDSGSNYGSAYVYGNSSSSTGAGAGPASTSCLIAVAAAATATSGQFGSAQVELIQYAGTTGNKVLSSVIADPRGSTYYAQTVMGYWASTSAITRITILPNTGSNWIAGSACALYGIA